MNAELLNKIGAALFGDNYTAGLCGALEVSPRAMRRWLNGSNDIPLRLAIELRRLVVDRHATLTTIMRDIDVTAT